MLQAGTLTSCLLRCPVWAPPLHSPPVDSARGSISGHCPEFPTVIHIAYGPTAAASAETCAPYGTVPQDGIHGHHYPPTNLRGVRARGRVRHDTRPSDQWHPIVRIGKPARPLLRPLITNARNAGFTALKWIALLQQNSTYLGDPQPNRPAHHP